MTAFWTSMPSALMSVSVYEVCPPLPWNAVNVTVPDGVERAADGLSDRTGERSLAVVLDADRPEVAVRLDRDRVVVLPHLLPLAERGAGVEDRERRSDAAAVTGASQRGTSAEATGG